MGRLNICFVRLLINGVEKPTPAERRRPGAVAGGRRGISGSRGWGDFKLDRPFRCMACERPPACRFAPRLSPSRGGQPRSEATGRGSLTRYAPERPVQFEISNLEPELQESSNFNLSS